MSQIIDEYQVYIAYQKAKADVANRGYRIPKNWDKTFDGLTKPYRDALKQASLFFSTKWQNVDLNTYMSCGFELRPSFSFKNFFDEHILEMYIRKDKTKKRKIDLDKTKIVESFKFISKVMSERDNLPGYEKVESFCKIRENKQCLVMKYYLKGNIDNLTMTYAIYKKYFIFNEEFDKELLFELRSRWNELLYNMQEVKDFIYKCEKTVNSKKENSNE